MASHFKIVGIFLPHKTLQVKSGIHGDAALTFKFPEVNNPFLRSAFFGLCSGSLSGLATTIFLSLLDQATTYRTQHLEVIWLLPLAGLAVGWIYDRFGTGAQGGNNLIIDQILVPKNRLPWLMAPLILFSTLITHLFGGSAGREGTAVQMGASLSDQITRFLRVSPKERKILLIAGAGAGFGSAIGTPWAGVFFGMEMIHFYRFKIVGLLECLIASWVAYGVTHVLRAPHTVFPSPDSVPFQGLLFVAVAVAGILWGILGGSFASITHLIEAQFNRWTTRAYLKSLLGGVCLVLLYRWEGSYRYVGLGMAEIQEAFRIPAQLSNVLYKFLFTAITLGSGFKGGEFVPLVFMGTLLGSFLSGYFPGSLEILTSVGFAAVFAGVSQTPFSCSILLMELFGIQMAPYALLGCFISYTVAARFKKI